MNEQKSIHLDGRRQRSERSRDAIVDAMLELVFEGDMHPIAADVAERAGVSARTVFRLFEDMDVLYAQMTSKVETKLLPRTMEPLKAEHWRDQIVELLERRTMLFEEIMPLRIAAGLRRYASPFVMKNYQTFLEIERGPLEAILPQAIKDDAALLAAISLTFSFPAWRRLREDQKLSPEDAQEALRRMLAGLLADAPA